LVSVYSLRWSASLLWALFVALWLARAFLITPNPQINPLDTVGALYLFAALALQVACFFAPSRRA
jgi:hypothetical protein